MNTIQTSPPRVRVAGKVLPATLSTEEAAAWLHCSAAKLQQKRGDGILPVEPLTLGHRLRWPTVQIAEALGMPVEVVTDDASMAEDAAEVHVLSTSSGAEPGGET